MVNIDDVYQKVLALANKEQRGYITPQEFNLFADHAQSEIFDQYYYDLEQFERRLESNIPELLNEKIQLFHRKINYSSTLIFASMGVTLPDTTTIQGDSYYSPVHEIDSVYLINPTEGRTLVQRISKKEAHGILAGPLTSTFLSPCYYMSYGKLYMSIPLAGVGTTGSGSHLWPYWYGGGGTNTQVEISYTTRPLKPNWTYIIVNGSAMYNNTLPGAMNFQLHSSEENNLVTKILALAGVAIKDLNLAQLAEQKEASMNQQEKQ